VVSKIPGVLLEVDVTRRPDGTPRGTVLRMVPLGKEPSVITTYEPAQGPRLVLVASFKDNHLLAVDMDTLQVFGAVRDVCASPYDIVVDERHGYAFVSCFNEDTVAVVRLPRSLDDRAFNLAAKLGTPRSDQNTNPDVPGFLPAIPNLN
jgi:DNA-binding beta-propeller fold protein YncE